MEPDFVCYPNDARCSICGGAMVRQAIRWDGILIYICRHCPKSEAFTVEGPVYPTRSTDGA